MGQGDVPTSRGGPFRRRREKRQLEHLAASTEREGTPRPAAAHVRVIEDQADAGQPVLEGQEPASPEETLPQPRTGGFHVRAVPIDQPLANEEV